MLSLYNEVRILVEFSSLSCDSPRLFLYVSEHQLTLKSRHFVLKDRNQQGALSDITGHSV